MRSQRGRRGELIRIPGMGDSRRSNSDQRAPITERNSDSNWNANFDPHRDLKPAALDMRCRCSWQLARAAVSALFAASLLVSITAAYAAGFRLASSERCHLSFGLYGAALMLHLVAQSVCATLGHREMRHLARVPPAQRGSVALCIAAFQEDPCYLRECLLSARRIAYPDLRVLMVVDGSADEDQYMGDIFGEVMGGPADSRCRWEGNFHSGAQDSDGESRVRDAVRAHRYACVMQRWGGKREAMYTAFRVLAESVDYIQVCDSDTVLDPACTHELARVLEADPCVGGVGGDVQILNRYASLLAFLSSVRYWVAFNVERACQSYFGCVQCISGPLGLYRSSLVREILEAWYGQRFLGSPCSFGDDRHLTNCVLGLGFSTKYTARARCLTETPAGYLRWLNQQTRWSKSYFREWLYSATCFHKHHLWMTYEAVVTGFFPFFLAATVVQLFYRGSAWAILTFLLIVQVVALLKAGVACALRGRVVMIFMSLYSLLYMSSLLPVKICALATVSSAGWGTSGRRTMVTNLAGLVPVLVWAAVLAGGVVRTVNKETASPPAPSERSLVWAGAALYVSFWVVLMALYLGLVARWCCRGRWRQHLYEVQPDV
ncbi:hyaluronan synthase 3-like [Lampetra planeri]